ncbi:MAG: hypothetical protein CL949_09445 [Erythrobacter sp.]|nr:hypothetical protein [Erythrobacter sp.]
MLIDSSSFREIASANLAACGLAPATIQHCTDALIAEARHTGFHSVAQPVSVHIAYDLCEAQSVYVVSAGRIMFAATPDRQFQPLAQSAVDPAQYALLDQMEQILLQIDRAIAISTHHVGPMLDPAVKSLQERYHALRNASLAINPGVHASIADPENWLVCSQAFATLTGRALTGHFTHRQAQVEYLEVIQKAA